MQKRCTIGSRRSGGAQAASLWRCRIVKLRVLAERESAFKMALFICGSLHFRTIVTALPYFLP